MWLAREKKAQRSLSYSRPRLTVVGVVLFSRGMDAESWRLPAVDVPCVWFCEGVWGVSLDGGAWYACSPLLSNLLAQLVAFVCTRVGGVCVFVPRGGGGGKGLGYVIILPGTYILR